MHMKKPFSLLVFLFLLAASGWSQKWIRLYPGKAPGSEQSDWPEKESFKNAANIHILYNITEPSIQAFIPEKGKGNGTAVVIAPGGGFLFLSIDGEGVKVAQWLQEHGVAAFVLKYRVAKALTEDPFSELFGGLQNHDSSLSARMKADIPLAMNDGLAAMAYVRTHASEFGVRPDRIGFMGFSAGGTVTMSVLHNAQGPERPNFAAPIYAYNGGAIGKAVPQERTPIFIVAASDDQLGLAPNSIDIYNMWISAKQPAELHLYQKGGHGFGMNKAGIPTDHWIERFGEWLQLEGLMDARPGSGK
jgi:acetyl esterase/lipase